MLRTPTLEQAGIFAANLGIHTEQEWAEYTAGQTRAELFKRVIEVMRTECAERK